MYEIFLSLLSNNNVRASDVSKATGINQAVFSEWKKGKSNPKVDKLQKIADYFNVSLEYLTTGNSSNINNQITQKDERDIAKKLDKIMEDIDKNVDSPLYYNGEEIDNTSKLLLRDAIESAMRQMKIINKEKYNPNKNKK